MRAEAFTMLALGSGPKQRTRLALQWRHISCEYGIRAVGQAWLAARHLGCRKV